MATDPTRGRPSKEKKQRNGPLSLALYQHFVDYLCGEFLPSPEDLLRAGFKSEANHPFKMQEKFMFWATKMTYDEESGYIVHKQTQKFIIPREKFDEAIRQAHVTDFAELVGENEEGATPKIELELDGRKVRIGKRPGHNGLNVTLKNLQSVYTFGRRSFGMTTEIVKKALLKCSEKKCCLFNRLWGPRKKGDGSKQPEEDELEAEEADDYDGRQDIGPDGDNLDTPEPAEEVDPYDLVFGCPTDMTDVPDFGCSEVYNTSAVGDNDAFADNPHIKSSMDHSNSFSSNGAHPLDYAKKSLSSSNIASRRFRSDETGIKRAVERPERAQHPDTHRPPSSAAGAPPDDEDKAELSVDSERSEVTKTIDGIQCTRTVLDGITFYEYDVPGCDTGQKTMSLAKRKKRRKGSECDDSDADYAPKQWKRWSQVDHMPMTRRSSSSDGEKKGDARVLHSKLMGDLDYLEGVSDVSSDEEVIENVGLCRVLRNEDGSPWRFTEDFTDPIIREEYVEEKSEHVRGQPTFGFDAKSQVDRFETILDIHHGPTKKKNTDLSRNDAERIEDVETRFPNRQSRTSTANQKHGKMASVDREDAKMDQRTTKPKVTDSPFHSQGRHMLPSFMESLGLQARPKPKASISSSQLVKAETDDVSDEKDDGLLSSRKTETNQPSSQVQIASPNQIAEDSLDRSFDDQVSEGVDVAGYVNYGSSQAEDSSNASFSQVSDADCNNNGLDSTGDKVSTSEHLSSRSDFLDGKEAILPNGRKVRVYCRNTEYSEPRCPKPSGSHEVDIDVIQESERDDKRDVQGKQRCMSPLTGGNRNIDPSSQEYRPEVPIGVIHPIRHNLTSGGDDIAGAAAHESAPADLAVNPEVTDQEHQDDTEEDTANRSFTKGDAIETPLSPVLKKLDPDVAIPGKPNNSEKSNFEDNSDKSPSTEGPPAYAVEMIQSKEKVKFLPLEGVEDGPKTPGSKMPWGHFQLKDGCLLTRDATPPTRITRSQMAVTPTKRSSPIDPRTPQNSPTLLSMGGTISVSRGPTVKSPAMRTQNTESDSSTNKPLKIFSGPNGKYYCFEPKTKSYRSILPKTERETTNSCTQTKTTRPKTYLPKTKWDPNNPNQKIDIVGWNVNRKVLSKAGAHSLPLKIKIILPASGSDESQSTNGETPVSQAASVAETVEEVQVVGRSERQVLSQMEPDGEKSVIKKRKGRIKEEKTLLKNDLDNASRGAGIRFVTRNSRKPLRVDRKRTVKQLLDLQNKDRQDNAGDHLVEDSGPVKHAMNLTIKELINRSKEMKEPRGIRGDREHDDALDVEQGPPEKAEQKVVDLDDAADSVLNQGEMMEQILAGSDVNNNCCGDEREVSNAKKDSGQRLDQSIGLPRQEVVSEPHVTLIDVTEECKKKSQQGDQLSSSVSELVGQEVTCVTRKRRKRTKMPSETCLKRTQEHIATIQHLRKQAGRYDYKKELESVRGDMTEEKFQRLRELVEIRLESQQAKLRVTQIMQQHIELMKQQDVGGVGRCVKDEQKLDTGSRDAREPSDKVSSSREKLKAAINLVNRCHGKVMNLGPGDTNSISNTTKPKATSSTGSGAKTEGKAPGTPQRGREQVTKADEQSAAATARNAAPTGQNVRATLQDAEPAIRSKDSAVRNSAAAAWNTDSTARNTAAIGPNKSESTGQVSEPSQSTPYSRPEVAFAKRAELPDHEQSRGIKRIQSQSRTDERQMANDQVKRIAEERQMTANRKADQRRMANDQLQSLAHDERQMPMAANQRQMTGSQRQMAGNQVQMAADVIADQRQITEVQRQDFEDQREFMTSVTGKVIPTGMKFYHVGPKSTAATSTTATHAISSAFDSSEYIHGEKRRMGNRTVQVPMTDPLEKQNVNHSRASHGVAGQMQCHGLGGQMLAAPTAADAMATLGARKGQEPMEMKTRKATRYCGDADVLYGSDKLDGEKHLRRPRKRIKRTESGDVELIRSGEGGVLELVRAGDGTKRRNPTPISSMPLPTAAHFSKVTNIRYPPHFQPRSCEASQKVVTPSHSSAHASSFSPPVSEAHCPPPTSSITCGVYTHPCTTYAYSHAPAYTTEPYRSNYVTPQKQHQRSHGQWASEATPPGRGSTPESSYQYGMMPVRPESAQRSSHCLFPASFAAAAYLPGVVGVPAAKAEAKKVPRVVDEYEMLTNTIRDMRTFIRPAQAGRRYSLNILGNHLIPTATDQVHRFRRLLEDERMKDIKQ